VIDAYPLQFVIGDFKVTGFGIMMMLAFLTAFWLISLEVRRMKFAQDYVGDILMAAMIGGIVGAKLWFVALHHAELFSRGGLVWYGGFVGGTLAVILVGWWRRVPLRWTAQLMAPAMAAGYAVGRVGCFVVGDDYGRPTTLPWGVRFPQGSPISTAGVMQSEFGIPIPPGVSPDTVMAVHPTQLYEVTIMLCVFALLWRWRASPRGTGWLFGAYLMLAGTERFFIEILRAKDDRGMFAPFTIAQVTSVAVVIIGSVLVVKWSKAGDVAPGAWLENGAVKKSAT
jgi:phosphatidylglycerol:prolipoprotein diacylglycerol transferase